MANVRIQQLPEDLTPVDTDVVAVDSTLGGTTRRVPIPNLGELVRPLASQPEAEAGSNNTNTMTPLRTKQQIDARLADEATAIAGTNATELLTPETGKASILANAKDGDWTQGQTDAPTRAIYLKMREQVSAFDDMSKSLSDAITAEEATSADKTEISSAINNMIDYFSTRGGQLLLPPGLYFADDIVLRDKLHLQGVFGATTIKLPDAGTRPIFNDPNIGASTSLKFLGFTGLIIDGNAANFDTSGLAKSNIALAGFEKLYFKDVISQNSTGYGIGLQARPGTAYDGPQTHLYMENVGLLNNGAGTPAAADTFDGLDAKKLDTATLIGVWADGNSDTGIDIRGREVTVLGGYSKNNGNFGYSARTESEPGRFTYRGCLAEANGPGTESFGHGFYCRSVDALDTAPLTVNYSGCVSRGNTKDGFNTGPVSQTLSVIFDSCTGEANGENGFYLPSSTMKSSAMVNCRGVGNTLSGAKVNTVGQAIRGGEFSGNARYGIEESTGANRNSYTAGIRLRTNTLGNWLFNTTNRIVSPDVNDFELNSSGGDILASAATLVLPEGGEVFDITGSTNITSVRSSPLVAAPSSPGAIRRNRRFTLRGSGGTATMTSTTGEIYLAAGESPRALSNRDTLTLVSNGGTEVHQVSAANN